MTHTQRTKDKDEGQRTKHQADPRAAVPFVLGPLSFVLSSAALIKDRLQLAAKDEVVIAEKAACDRFWSRWARRFRPRPPPARRQHPAWTAAPFGPQVEHLHLIHHLFAGQHVPMEARVRHLGEDDLSRKSLASPTRIPPVCANPLQQQRPRHDRVAREVVREQVFRQDSGSSPPAPTSRSGNRGSGPARSIA